MKSSRIDVTRRTERRIIDERVSIGRGYRRIGVLLKQDFDKATTIKN